MKKECRRYFEVRYHYLLSLVASISFLDYIHPEWLTATLYIWACKGLSIAELVCARIATL